MTKVRARSANPYTRRRSVPYRAVNRLSPLTYMEGGGPGIISTLRATTDERTVDLRSYHILTLCDGGTRFTIFTIFEFCSTAVARVHTTPTNPYINRKVYVISLIF